MTKVEQYAKWCIMLMEGEDHMLDDIWAALYEDGYVDEGGQEINDDDDN